MTTMEVPETEMIARIESAAKVMMSPPSIVSKAQRTAAEKVLLDFRQSAKPFKVCSHLVQHSSNDFVRFQAVSTMKDAIIREWALSCDDDIQQLLSFLLDYVVNHANSQAYVREQILSTIAVVLKRSALDKDPSRFAAYRSQLFEKVAELLKHPDEALRMIGCSVLGNLLNEFSSSSRSSALGVAWDFHTDAKEAFEKHDLKEILTLILHMLHRLDESPPSASTRSVVVLWNRLLSLVVQIFSWEFVRTQPKALKRRFGSFEATGTVAFRPPLSWRQLLFTSSLLKFLFKIHHRVRHNSELCHHLFQCLTHLASLGNHISIFAKDDDQVAFLKDFVEGVLGIMRTSAVQDYESPGLSSTVSQLLRSFSPSVFMSLPGELFSNFIYGLTHLTRQFGAQAANEESANKEDHLFLEGYETLLRAWMTLLDNTKDFAPATFRLPALDIVNGFLQSHLAPPDGNRGVGEKAAEDDDEIQDEDGDDKENMRSQLICVGKFFREAVDHGLPLLNRVLDARIVTFKLSIQRLINGDNAEAPSVFSLFEDLHWLILLASHATVEEDEDFSSSFKALPSAPILEHLSHSAKSGAIDEQKTAEILSGVTSMNWSERLLEDGVGVDPLVRLFASLLHLSTTTAFILKLPTDKNEGSVRRASELLSPEIASDLFYFFSRMSRIYFLYDLTTSLSSQSQPESQKSQLQPPKVFASTSSTATFILDLLLDHIIAVLVHWSSEPQVVSEAVALLKTFVDTKLRAAFVVSKSAKLWELTEIACNPKSRSQLAASLPVQVQRDLMLCLTLVGASISEESLKQKYWRHVLEPIRSLFQGIVDRIPTPDKARTGIIITQSRYPLPSVVVGVLESLVGVALSARVHSLPWLFDFLSPMMDQCPYVLSAFNTSPEVVEPVLRLANTVVQHSLPSLNDTQTNRLYQICMDIVQTYFKHNVGKHSYESSSEDEQFSDLFILMDLLTNLLNKDVLDFWSVDENSNPSEPASSAPPVISRLSSADVVLCAINFVIPLMNEELLKFPPLCSHYYKLLQSVAEIFPEKIATLPEENFRTLLNTISMGLSSFGSQVSSASLTFLDALATHVGDPSSIPPHVFSSLSPFLTSLFSLLLLEPHFDMELLEVASRAFFALITLFKDDYLRCVNELLTAHAHQPHQPRLVEAFHALTPPDLPLSAQNRTAVLTFVENMQNFLLSVRGLLCMK